MAEPLEKSLGWREVRERLLITEWGQLLTWRAFLGVKTHSVRGCCLSVSPIIFVCVSLKPQSSVSKAELFIFPQICPCSWASHLDKWWLCLCILYEPEPSASSFPHPSSSPMSNQSPSSINSVSLISLATNSLHSTLTPTALMGVSTLAPGLCAYWATLQSLEKLHVSLSPGFCESLSSAPNPSFLLPVFS